MTVLDEYFDQYKYSKVTNTMTPRFIQLAEQEVSEKLLS